MHFFTDRMSGSMHKLLSVPDQADHLTTNFVDLPAIGELPGGHPLLHKRQGRITPPSNAVKDLSMARGNITGRKSGPGNISIYRPWFRALRPQVDQHQAVTQYG